MSKKKRTNCMNTVDNCKPWVIVTVCHGVVEADTITVTVTTMTEIPWCYLYPRHTLDIQVGAGVLDMVMPMIEGACAL